MSTPVSISRRRPPHPFLSHDRALGRSIIIGLLALLTSFAVDAGEWEYVDCHNSVTVTKAWIGCEAQLAATLEVAPWYVAETCADRGIAVDTGECGRITGSVNWTHEWQGYVIHHTFNYMQPNCEDGLKRDRKTCKEEWGHKEEWGQVFSFAKNIIHDSNSLNSNDGACLKRLFDKKKIDQLIATPADPLTCALGEVLQKRIKGSRSG